MSARLISGRVAVARHRETDGEVWQIEDLRSPALVIAASDKGAIALLSDELRLVICLSPMTQLRIFSSLKIGVENDVYRQCNLKAVA